MQCFTTRDKETNIFCHISIDFGSTVMQNVLQTTCSYDNTQGLLFVCALTFI